MASSSRHRKCKMNDEETARWKIVKERKVHPPKFFDRPTLEVLGLLECTQLFLNNTGLGGYIDLHAPAYADLCFNFIATFNWDLDADGEYEKLSFKYEERVYTVHIDQVRAALGVTMEWTENWVNSGLNDVELCRFWLDATRCVFRPGQEYNARLTHPYLRLTHKLLMNGLFGHNEDNKVSFRDLSHFLSVLSESDVVPDWVDIFFKGLVKIREGAARDITQGGLITLIVQNVLDTTEFDRPKNPILFTQAKMRNASMMKMHEKRLVWCSRKDCSHVMGLPRFIPYGPEWKDYYLESDLEVPADNAPVFGGRQLEFGGSSGGTHDEQMHDGETGGPRSNPWEQPNPWAEFRTEVCDQLRQLNTTVTHLQWRQDHMQRRQDHSYGHFNYPPAPPSPEYDD